MKPSYRVYDSSNSTGQAVDSIIGLRAAAIAKAPDITLFLGFALVWAAVFFVVLSSKL